MSVTKGLTKGDGIFPSVAKLQESKVAKNHTVAVNDGSNTEWYNISTTNNGNGVLLNSGLWANPTGSPSVRLNKPNDQTGTAYTLQPGDEGKTVWMNNAAANVITIDTDANQITAYGSAIEDDAVIMGMQEGVGVTTFTAVAGVTLNGVDAGSVVINAQYSGATLIKRSANTWIITGNIT
jgi:hypothetical protein